MRKAGILMHISSLPSEHGIGTVGKKAYEFVDFLKRTNQGYWQVLPLNPISYGNSPYQSPSVFAGNALLIDLDSLKEEGLLSDDEINSHFYGDNPEKVDFYNVTASKTAALKTAFSHFERTREYNDFTVENEFWLDSFALYMALKDHFEGKPWTEWEDKLKKFRASEVKKYTQLLWQEIEFYKFTQFEFFKQWTALKKYANKNGIKIIGDIPIYTSLDSSDVWTNTKQFKLDADGLPVNVAGCPPDAFSEDGQVWGNPLYDWHAMAQDNYVWWINRIKASMKLYDVIRLDHFRGFESYYAIPFGEETAKNGHWEKGPDIALFKTIKSRVRGVEFIAEDLGFLTDDVKKMLRYSGFPGMKVLQFAFDPYSDNPYLPYNHTENCVVYTGTHDNDTLIEWYNSEQNKEFIRDYLNVTDGGQVPQAMIRMALASSARIAVIPIQDYLGYGARMNTPSTLNEDNWSFRIRPDALHDGIAYEIAHLTKLYKRDLNI